jgi:hypothetical protein
MRSLAILSALGLLAAQGAGAQTQEPIHLEINITQSTPGETKVDTSKSSDNVKIETQTTKSPDGSTTTTIHGGTPPDAGGTIGGPTRPADENTATTDKTETPQSRADTKSVETTTPNTKAKTTPAGKTSTTDQPKTTKITPPPNNTAAKPDGKSTGAPQNNATGPATQPAVTNTETAKSSPSGSKEAADNVAADRSVDADADEDGRTKPLPSEPVITPDQTTSNTPSKSSQAPSGTSDVSSQHSNQTTSPGGFNADTTSTVGHRGGFNVPEQTAGRHGFTVPQDTSSSSPGNDEPTVNVTKTADGYRIDIEIPPEEHASTTAPAETNGTLSGKTSDKEVASATTDRNAGNTDTELTDQQLLDLAGYRPDLSPQVSPDANSNRPLYQPEQSFVTDNPLLNAASKQNIPVSGVLGDAGYTGFTPSGSEWLEDFNGNGPSSFNQTWGPGAGMGAITYNNGIARIAGVPGVSGYDAQAGIANATGAADSGFGYGLYEFRIKMESTDGKTGDGSGPAVGLWAADDRWPDGEIDLGEIDHDGKMYYAEHWGGTPENMKYAIFGMPEGTNWSDWHTTAVLFGKNENVYYLDGKEIARAENHIPAAVDGGVNRVPFIMNRSETTALETDWVRFTPSQ